MRPICLIGMMGSGKTTIGKALAIDLNLTWIDTDDYIEAQTQKQIATIFEKSGEQYFRELEKKALMKALPYFECISTGGGSIIAPENRDLLKKNAYVIYLTAEIKTLANRLTRANRPLLKNEPLEEKLAALFEVRADLYQTCADLTIVTDDLTIAEVIAQIKQRMGFY